MANLKEEAVFDEGIYQIEKSDPVVGGADGISNRQAKALANRTQFLKEKTEELAGDLEALEDAVSVGSIQALVAACGKAMLLAKYANETIDVIHKRLNQHGSVVIYNRGVITGCTVTKSENAARNISLSEGRIFYGARVIHVASSINKTAIPSNVGTADAVCYCYLKEENSKMVFRCTQLNEEAPEDSLILYRISIPAGNTSETDATSSAVVLTDIRRKEPGYPTYYRSAAFAQIALPFAYVNADYQVHLDVIDYAGSGYEQGLIYAAERAANGFKIYTNGTVDKIRVNWTTTMEVK